MRQMSGCTHQQWLFDFIIKGRQGRTFWPGDIGDSASQDMRACFCCVIPMSWPSCLTEKESRCNRLSLSQSQLSADLRTRRGSCRHIVTAHQSQSMYPSQCCQHVVMVTVPAMHSMLQSPYHENSHKLQQTRHVETFALSSRPKIMEPHHHLLHVNS